jgi:hypothetical protein
MGEHIAETREPMDAIRIWALRGGPADGEICFLPWDARAVGIPVRCGGGIGQFTYDLSDPLEARELSVDQLVGLAP